MLRRAAWITVLGSVVACGALDVNGALDGVDPSSDAGLSVDGGRTDSPPPASTVSVDGSVAPSSDDASIAPVDGAPAACTDVCAATNGGITWQCEKRFLFGINYAWQAFGADFGGIAAWSQKGVAADEATHAQNLAAMAANGANVVRWWIFPDLRSDGITFDDSDTPTGLGGTAAADIAKALELADQANVFLMFTVFSFDSFRPTNTVSNLKIPGLGPIARDSNRRAALMTNVVRPLARAVEASPHRRRMIAWDVINEPEWAIAGKNPYGDPNYTPGAGLDPISHVEMETLVKDTIAALRAESHALVSVGGAAVKWAHAWSAVDIDFYQFHYYDWVNKSWPYTTLPATYGLAKPIVIGEFPSGDLSPGVHYADVVSSFFANGYAGAMAWQFNQATPADLAAENTFSTAHACQTHFDAQVTLSKPVSPPPPPIASKSPVNVRFCHPAPSGIPTCDPVD